MSRRKRFLCVLLALAAVIGGICCWQRNNLRALGMSLRLSQEELSGEMDRQRERTEEASRQAGVNVRALTDEVEFRTSEAGAPPLAAEGRGDKNSWMVLDYGSVMVHVFTRDARQFYNLDKLYSDTEKVEVSPRAEAEEADSAE